ncbi:YoaK family protein [Microbacterium gilvum]|uniref:YoaK family protein n=1 Tax=Microbacterium gilvum TaxID=1336204 RepID=A0ABP8ZY59_9MICO
MREVTRRGFALSAMLSGVAGFVDAIGFIDTGGLFVSFMSGNSTQAGVALLDEAPATALFPLALVGSFLGGVIVAAISAGSGGGNRARPVAGAAMLLAVSAVLAWTAPTSPVRFALLAAAMGALNTLYIADGRARVAITYATGTLVSLGLAIADAIAGRSSTAWRRPLLLWGSLGAGAAAGAATHRLGSGIALAVAAGILAVAAIALARRRTV